jgi:hypothetical protein
MLRDLADRRPYASPTTSVTATWYDDEDRPHTIEAEYEMSRGGVSHWSDVRIDGEPARWEDCTGRHEDALLRALEADDGIGRDEDG